MRAAILSLVVGSLFVMACGGNEPPPANPAPAVPNAPSAEHSEHAEHHEEHGKISQPLHDFHEVLAPMWHSTPGTERVAKTCAGQKDLSAKATAVGDAELSAATDAVKTACDKPDHADVEVKLGAVHDRFHKLAETPAK